MSKSFRCAAAQGFVVLRTILIVVILAMAGCGDDHGRRRAIAVDLSGDPIVVETTAMRVEVGRGDARIAVFDRLGGELYTRAADEAGLYYERGVQRHHVESVTGAEETADGVALTLSTTEEVGAQLVLSFPSARTLAATFTPGDGASLSALGGRWLSPADEVIYGLTERLRDSRLVPQTGVPIEDIRPLEVGSLNRRGETVEMFIRPTQSLYAPFYQSSRGYGLAIAGTMPGVFDLANTEAGIVQFRFEAGTTAENRRLAFEIFVGPGHDLILDEYTARTGRPLVPPPWAFLNWRWRDELPIGPPADLDGVAMNAVVVEDITRFEELGIPPGVYLLDRPVLRGNFGFGRFEWDEERLPNAAAMLAALRRRGYRVVTWSATWVCGDTLGDNGSEAQRLGYTAPGPQGPPNCANIGGTSFILDVTNAAARDWFAGKIADFVGRWDLDGIKLDRGEEHIASAAGDIWADGRNGREVHNDYVDLQTTLHYDALTQARGDDFVLITRSGYRGTQRHAVVWGGDTAGSESFGIGPATDLGLRSVIIAQLRAAFMGYPIWGSDTGGYYEFKDREVFARWIELSAFSGIMEIGGEGTHAPWDMPTEPRFDEEMIAIYRRYTRLRAQLQEYIVAAAGDAGARGLPIARPLVFYDRGDPQLRDLWDQYLFGPDLMVAPVWRSGQRQRDVYFPAGEWRSLWNPEERYRGPATVAVSAPLDVIPVYVRGDAASPVAGASLE